MHSIFNLNAALSPLQKAWRLVCGTTVKFYDYAKRYPSRASGWGYVVAETALAASGALQLMQGETGGGISVLFSGLANLVGSASVLRWGDPEIVTDKKPVDIDDPQDWPVWKRLVSPRKAPHDFSALMCVPGALCLCAAALFNPTLPGIVMAITALPALLAVMSSQKVKSPSAPSTAPASPIMAFSSITEKCTAFIQEKPLRAAFYLFAPCNAAQVWDGITRNDKAMIASGVVFFFINALRSRADKRIRIIPTSQAAEQPPRL